MALNWIEQLVSDLYRLRDYLVHTNIDLPLRKDPDRAVGGHSDIDVLAANGEEVVHCECQTYWVVGPKDEEKEFRRLQVRFEEGERRVRTSWPFLFPRGDETLYRRLFVVGGRPEKSTPNGPYVRLDRWAKGATVAVLDVDTVLSDYLRQLKKRYPDPMIVGLERGQAGLLQYLLKEGWLE